MQLDTTLAGRVVALIEKVAAAAIAIRNATEDERACFDPNLLALSDKMAEDYLALESEVAA